VTAAVQGRRVRRQHIEDAVDSLLWEARRFRYPLALFISQSGDIAVMPKGDKFEATVKEHPHALVGVYGQAAQKADIIEDAWIRCAAIGIEWP